MKSNDIEEARKFADLRAKQVKRYEWLQQFGKTERDILSDEVGDDYVCFRTEDKRCVEARYLPDGLQHLGPVSAMFRDV